MHESFTRGIQVPHNNLGAWMILLKKEANHDYYHSSSSFISGELGVKY